MTLHSGVGNRDVNLNDLIASARSGILDRNCDTDRIFCTVSLRLTVCKAGIAQTIAKGISRLISVTIQFPIAVIKLVEDIVAAEEINLGQMMAIR